MIRIVSAELRRLLRRRTIAGVGVGVVVFAAVATLSVFAAAEATVEQVGRGGVAIADLTDAGGGTEAFATGASFAGFLVFVTFIALVATEFSGGTLRALLLRNPHRLQVVGGKLAAALLVAAGALAAAEVVTFGLSLVAARANDVATDAWFSVDAVGNAVGDFATVLAGVAGWAAFGTTLAVIFRSVPLALGVGFAWAGPFENIVVDSWGTGFRVFPGQVLGAVIQGGNPEISLGRALATAAVYVAVAAVVAAALLTRRDVTS